MHSNSLSIVAEDVIHDNDRVVTAMTWRQRSQVRKQRSLRSALVTMNTIYPVDLGHSTTCCLLSPFRAAAISGPFISLWIPALSETLLSR